MKSVAEIIKESSSPLEPIPTAVEPRLERLTDVRAVMFDVYGTLFVSGCGDVGTSIEASRGRAVIDALRTCGVETSVDADRAAEVFLQSIKSEQQTARDGGIATPEVDIVLVWKKTAARFAEDGVVGGAVNFDAIPWQHLAVEFECRVNPVWPMPGARNVIDTLHTSGRLLGLISNAQFFTPLLFESLMDADLPGMGVAESLCFYSWQHRQAKPGTFLFDRAVAALDEMGVAAGQTLYIGNDMLNDVYPSAAAGFRTALFAGDQRSLRQREDDDRVKDLRPDLVVTQLPQLLDCVRS